MTIPSRIPSLLLFAQLAERNVSARRAEAVATVVKTAAKSFDRYRERVKETLAAQAKKKVYIHRGSDEFKPELMNPIKNEWHKPKGHTGLWASPIDAERGWLEWCEAEQFQTGPLDKFFRFTIRDQERVFYAHDKESTQELIRKYYIPRPSYVHDEHDAESICAMLDTRDFTPPTIDLDFEAMERDGWVGLEINLSEYPQLYWLLYGWDCDSIVVFSPDQIELVD